MEQDDSNVKVKDQVEEQDTELSKEPGAFIGYEVLGIDSMF